MNHLNFSLAGIDLDLMSHDDFNNLVLRICDQNAPLKMKYVRGNDQPFVTKELRKEHMKRTRLLNKYRKQRNTENESAYKKQRNFCSNLLKRVKSAYYGSLRPSDITDNKKFWGNVKPLFSDKCVLKDDITLNVRTGFFKEELISDDDHLAHIFNNFFSNAVKSLNIDYFEHFSFDCVFCDSEDEVTNAIEKYSKHPSIVKIKEHYPENTTFSFQNTDLESVYKLVMNLDASKSAPIESVPVRVLKDIADVLCPKLVIDFNKAISTGTFPQHMKLADVIPLFKKDIRQLKENYRPVSLLSALSKVFERLIHKQMHEYMLNKLSIFLCGFQKEMNAQNCLLFLVEQWRKGLDKSQKLFSG